MLPRWKPNGASRELGRSKRHFSRPLRGSFQSPMSTGHSASVKVRREEPLRRQRRPVNRGSGCHLLRPATERDDVTGAASEDRRRQRQRGAVPRQVESRGLALNTSRRIDGGRSCSRPSGSLKSATGEHTALPGPLTAASIAGLVRVCGVAQKWGLAGTGFCGSRLAAIA